jgi:5-methylcytosine-specific restriction endonuclease McrA
MTAAFVPLEFPSWLRWGQRRGAFIDNVALRESYPDHKLWTRRPDATMGYVGAVRRCGWCATECRGRRTQWCSDSCAEKFYRVWSWGAVAQYVLARDGKRCVRCATTERGRFSWECDHIVPVLDGGTDNPANLRTLCHGCHVAAGIEQRRARKARLAPELNLGVVA